MMTDLIRPQANVVGALSFHPKEMERIQAKGRLLVPESVIEDFIEEGDFTLAFSRPCGYESQELTLFLRQILDGHGYFEVVPNANVDAYWQALIQEQENE